MRIRWKLVQVVVVGHGDDVTKEINEPHCWEAQGMNTWVCHGNLDKPCL